MARSSVIPLVAPTITTHDRGRLYDRIDAGLLDDEQEVALFEEAFAARVNCKHAVAVCSGTTALQLALTALDVRLVSVPTYGCVALRNAAMAAGCGIRFVDSRYDVANAIMTQGLSTHPQIVMHAFGNLTLDYSPGPTIEDYTLSLGGIQTLHGDVGVCSTHQSKMISTGRGGVVFGNDTALLERVRDLACYDNVNPAREGSQSLGMSPLQAALGLSQLSQLESFIARRRELAERYTESIRGYFPKGDVPLISAGVFFRYLIRVKDPAKMVAELGKRGIEAGRGVYPPLHRMIGQPDDRYPGAVESVNSLLSVPCYPALTDAEAEFIAEQVVDVCGR